MPLSHRLHALLLQAVHHIIERILVRQCCKSLERKWGYQVDQMKHRSMFSTQLWTQARNWLANLIDKGHGVDQQLCVYTILLMQDFHGIGPRFRAWKTHTSFVLSVHKIPYVLLSLSTSFGVHRGNGFDQQRSIALGVLHKHQQELQSCFYHQAKLTGGKICYKSPEIIGKDMHTHIYCHIPALKLLLCNVFVIWGAYLKQGHNKTGKQE